MAFSLMKVIKGILLREEGTLTPKELEIQPGGTSGTKTTVVGSQTTNKTLTLPDATDTLVARATTDTLTNKTIDADLNIISNIENADIKALAAIDATKIANGSVDNSEFQNINGLTSPAVGTTQTQTLTNKTLTSPIINSPTGITKSDVGLSNVDNTSDATKNSAVATLTNKTIDADLNTITNIENADIKAGAAIDATKIANGSVSNAEFQQLDGLTSPAVGTTQSQTLSNKILQLLQETTANDSTTTGSNTTLAAFTTGVVRLTNASLVSLSGIPAGASVQSLTLENQTGNQIIINNDDAGASSANRIYTGTAANIQLKNNASILLKYDTTASRWMLIGGVGANASGSGKNYLTTYLNNPGNGDFEANSTTGWSLFNTTLTSGIPTGAISAGAAQLSFSTVSSGQLAGSYSLSVRALDQGGGGVWVAGQGVISDAFTIDKEDQAKVLSFKFAYSPISNGNRLNFSGTSSNTLAVYIYDVTNSAWIQPAGVYNLVQNSGVGMCTGSFQTTANSTQYRIAVLAVNSSGTGSGDIVTYFDDYSVGPQNFIYGAIGSDWVAYTPTFTGFGTVSAVSFYSRRVLDTLQVVGMFTTGTNTAVNTQISLGFNGSNNNVTADVSKVPIASLIGFAEQNIASSTDFGAGVLAPSSNSSFVFLSKKSSTTSGTSIALGTNFSNSTVIEVAFSVPIVGWTSNTVLSNDTDTRVVSYYSTSQVATGTINTGYNTVVLGTKSKDTHGAFNTSTGQYTVPVTGFYDMVGGVDINATFTAGQYVGCRVINSTTGEAHYSFAKAYGSVTSDFTSVASGQVYATAGDILKLDSICQGTTPTYSGSLAGSFLSIKRATGPTTSALSETVSMKYTSTAGTSLGTGNNTLSFATKAYDSHNQFSSNTTYTIPISGKYTIKLKITTNTIASTSTNTLSILVNGSVVSEKLIGLSYATTSGYTFDLSDSIDVLAGQTVTFRFNNGFGSSVNMTTAVGQNSIAIEKVGN